MKKTTLFAIATFFLFSCSSSDEIEIGNQNSKTKNLTSRLASGQFVKLIKAKDSRTYTCNYGTCASYQMREYIVEVKNLSYNKTVVVHQELNNGQWEDISLTFSSTTNTGTEIWKTTTVKTIYGNNPSPTTAYGEKVAVKYQTNGQTYWDNNNGNNYFIANFNRHASSSFLYLNQAFTISQSNASFYSYAANSFVNITAEIRNIAYAKEVTMVYSTDNWATTHNYPLNYDSTTYIINDSPEYERWSASFSIPIATKVNYALSYKVNGITYWDNNFGQNYTLVHPVN